VEFNTIANIHKYKGFREGCHFILMAMEVHSAPRRDMDRFIKGVFAQYGDLIWTSQW
jgi:hypothetical protein